jgi:hypothetical protein
LAPVFLTAADRAEAARLLEVFPLLRQPGADVQ